jgi:predicted transglutaminase-like cysteine proteinase
MAVAVIGQATTGTAMASGPLPLGPVTSPPIGWVQFCLDNPAECATPTAPDRMRLTGSAYADLLRINTHVNTTIEPVSDIEAHGVIEHWSYPTTGKGDCEDYALLKKALLVRIGWPPGALLVTVVRDRDGDGHAVLLARTDRGDYVLDNQDPDVRLWRETGYRFIKGQSPSHPNVWVTLGPGTAPPLVSSR